MVDISKEGSAIIVMGRQKFVFKVHEIRMNTEESNGNPHVARVTVSKPMVIPPNSAAQVRCNMDQKMSEYKVEPIQSQKILNPRLLHSTGTYPVVHIVNCTERYKLLGMGKEVATFTPIVEFLSEEEECTSSTVCEV